MAVRPSTGTRATRSWPGWRTRSTRTPRPHLPAPGLHRLNRTEYTNAIRDLLALNIDAATFLPADDSSHGFDNMAGTLTTSPALMEAYLSAAGKISRLGVGTETAPTLAVFDAPHDTSQNGYIEGLPFGTRGGMLIEHEFPADGNYVFTVKGMTGYFTAVLGNVKGEKLEVTIDGARVYLYDWDTEIGNQEGNGGRTPEIPIKAGFHRVGVTFIATSDLPDTGLNKSFVRTMNSPGSISGYTFYPHVGQVFIEGPFNGVRGHRARRAATRSSSATPKSSSEESECARKIISTLASKAFRRPATDADIEDDDGLLPKPDVKKAAASITASRRWCSASSRIRSSSTDRRSSLPRSRRGRPTGSAIWSWPRASRSSSGAAFRTRS